MAQRGRSAAPAVPAAQPSDPAGQAVPAEPTDPAAAPARRGPKAARFRSIRFKVVLMVTVSVVSLAALWSFAANIALGEGLNLRHVETVQDHYAYPAGALGSALQEERRLSMVYLGARDQNAGAALESGRLVTDRQARLFRDLARHGEDQDVPGRTLRLADKILQSLDGLGDRRRAIDSGAVDRHRAFADYTALLSDVGSLQGSLVTLDNAEVAKDARSQAELTEAREALSQENAWLAGALAAGRMTAGEHSTFVQLVGAQRTLYAHAAADLRPADRRYYEQVVQFPEYRRLRAIEEHFVGSRRAVAESGEAGRLWRTTVDSNLTRLRGLELSLAANAEQRAEPISDRIIMRVVLAGALGVLALVASLVIAVWVARSIIRELARLRREAIDLADVRLPDVVARLRRGENVDVAAEAPPLAFAAREIDEVGEAFNAARRTAIQEAVAEATLRRNVSEVFVNLARRSQTLLHRQLKLLDAMERRIEEPDDLEDLFRVDHLATRMRRHAEGLIILSGRPPGRGWRTPVAVVDVARAAASEVEDYTRVNVAPMTGAAVVGPAVADVIHLLAELIENATVFSPPHTTVQVHGQAVAHGYSIEVEDRGLSMDDAALAAANERLATAEEFDLSDSGRLGLFVVGRLARRHGVRVTLRTSPYGGMTAIVLLPEDLIVRADEPDGPPALTTRRAEEALVPAGTVVSPARPGEDRGAVLRLPASMVGDVPAAPRGAAPPGGSANGARRPDGPGAPGDRRTPLPRRRRGAPQPGEAPYEPWQDDAAAPDDVADDVAEDVAGNVLGDVPDEADPLRPSRFAPEPPAPPARPEETAPAEPEPERADRGDVPDGGAPSERQRPLGDVRRRKPGAERPALPKRVRQQNMAAQLRDAEPAAADGGAEEPAPARRTPEEARAMMSSIQRGTRRGRAQVEDGEDSG
ncbi:nitrate- and nitrite sensing domain-containing protein [Actinomadura sp. WAC 06369]|uniref:nitrate- and nitrite sensing domain-containing protein n=1 Tax=Actinomadura sp. WAC 06369 TaxID=2203193 RepID=UPI000F7967B4|nr:nitrate- and nitrite sensing domain-containing protein [Actinomadura sp. WAC 06369]RSN69987.1 histidine kinase [Actinomadura sp. WAC 06369]